jgi:hypothetical protein
MNQKENKLLKIATKVFDDEGVLKVILQQDWDTSCVSVSDLKVDNEPNDIPF